MTPPAGALVYLLSMVLFWKTPKPPPPPPDANAGPTPTNTRIAIPSWDFVNPEADQMMDEIRSARKALETRQKQMEDTAKNIEAQKNELEKAKDSVGKMQKDFDQIVLRVKDDEVANLKRLAKVYANVTPETAASIFANFDDTVIVKLMMFMKDNDTAVLLENLAKKGDAETKRAAAISERLRLSHSANTKAAK
jgi:flagellar motility protein MotE (MotC chaperone)